MKASERRMYLCDPTVTPLGVRGPLLEIQRVHCWSWTLASGTDWLRRLHKIHHDEIYIVVIGRNVFGMSVRDRFERWME